MNFLLKITEGPMRGAEVVLIAGTRVKVGTSDECDIVLADASLAPVAFELDVAESSVTLITPDGTQRPLEQFEVCDFGTTAVAIGPADAPWGELKRPVKTFGPAEAASGAAPAADGEAAPAADDAGSAEPAADGSAKERPGRKRSGCIGCILTLVIVLATLAAVAWLLWTFWPPARGYVEGLVGGGSGGEEGESKAVEQYRAEETLSLSDIASQHGLELAEDNGRPVLKGNLAKRTERLAIRALALAADPACAFEVTDNETMLTSSQELLFAFTEGAIKAVAASNRTVVLTGFAPSPTALERAIRALDKDVKGIEKLDTSQVTVGGIAPTEVAETSFVKEMDVVVKDVKKAEGEVTIGRPGNLIAGILTAPYPCVVMRNGHRVMEGAQIGTAILEKIEADRLVLSEAGKTFEWRP